MSTNATAISKTPNCGASFVKNQLAINPTTTRNKRKIQLNIVVSPFSDRLCLDTKFAPGARPKQGRFMNRQPLLAILLVSMVPLCAQAQQPNTAKLKADAQKVVNIIRADKAKTQAYCQINSLGGEIDLAAQARDEQKADVLTTKINDLEKDFQDILSMFDTLDQSCPH
jgi:hypothetical protein